MDEPNNNNDVDDAAFERPSDRNNNSMMSLTQNDDCVVWDESRNIDLRQLASPNSRTPKSAATSRSSGASSAATTSSSVSSNNNNKNTNMSGQQPQQQQQQHPQQPRRPPRRRRSSLMEVSRDLQQPVVNGSGLHHHHNNNNNNNPVKMAPEQEMDGIFRRLANDTSSDSTTAATPKQTNTSALLINSNKMMPVHQQGTGTTTADVLKSSEPPAALRLEAENIFGVQPARRRRRTQKRQKLLRAAADAQEQEPAAITTNNRMSRRPGHHHHHLRNINTNSNNNNNNTHHGGPSSTEAAAAETRGGESAAGAGLCDDFEDLLQQVTTTLSPAEEESAASKGKAAPNETLLPPVPNHLPPGLSPMAPPSNLHRNNNNIASSLPAVGSQKTRKVSTTPPPHASSRRSSDDDDFADFDFTEDDLNAIEIAATQHIMGASTITQQQNPHNEQVQQKQHEQLRPPKAQQRQQESHERCHNAVEQEEVVRGENEVENGNNSTNNEEEEEEEDDPFAEFPMIDYDALDRSILEATQPQGNDCDNDQGSGGTKTTSVQPHRSPMPVASTAAASASNRRVAPPNSSTQHQASNSESSSRDKSAGGNDKNGNDDNDDDDDLFVDFPEVDFEALDQAIANHTLTQQQPATVAAEQPSNAHSPGITPEGIARDLDFLAKVGRRQQEQRQQEALFQAAPPPTNALVRNRRSNQSPPVMGELSFPNFTRYKVVRVVEGTAPDYIKTLFVATWRTSMLENDGRNNNGTARTFESKRTTTCWPANGAIHLRGEWYHTRIEEGDVIHLCSLSGNYETNLTPDRPVLLHTYPPPGSDPNDDLVLIIHPDMLLTPTIISETASCTRRAILKGRLGSSGLTSKALIFGTMRHELFETTMRERNFSISFARDYMDKIIRRNAEGLLASNVSSNEAIQEVMKMVPTLQQFATQLTAFGSQRQIQPGSMAELQGHGASPPIQFRAKAVDAIEEPIISHELGLKGNVDMIVEASVVAQNPKLPGRQAVASNGVSKALVGVELKTGHNQRTQHAHLAQLILYTLMIKGDRGESKSGIRAGTSLGATNSGVLLYLNAEGMSAVHMAPQMYELKTLLGQRNNVAVKQVQASRPRGVQLTYEDDGQSKIVLLDPPPPAALPELLADDFMCKKCFANRECMMYAGAERSATALDNQQHDPFKSHDELLRQFTGHLTAADFSYFQEWDRLIDLEAHAGVSLAAESWLVPSHEREQATAKCMSSLVFDQPQSLEGVVFDENSYGDMSFSRSKTSSIQTPLLNLGFEKGCHVIVSTDSSSTSVQPSPRRVKMHIVRGFMARATESQVVLRATRDDFIRLQKIVESRSRQSQSETLFRLDRDNVATGVGTLRQNLVNLFTGDRLDDVHDDTQPNTSRLSWLRDMIVRLRAPVFRTNIATSEMFSLAAGGGAPPIPGCDLLDLACEFAALNPDQQNAVMQVWSANDYALIQGLPGTGKTQTISFVVRLLAAHGKRVLVTSYTHAAVDNVVRKLMSKGLAETSGQRLLPALVRVGRTSSCHPSVVPVLASEIAASLEGSSSESRDPDSSASPLPESLRRTMDAARIVGVTALTIPRSALLLGQQFDVVIVDEAGQISQPAVIGALMTTKSFVLVGDHKQLPPLVTSEAAEQGGYGISMLMRLADQHPSAVAQLALQYRMHEDICQLCNDLVYGGTLKCASDGVRRQKLDIPAALRQPQNQAEWLKRAVNPDCSVVFLDTDQVSNGEENQAANAMHPQERLAGRSSGGSIVNDTEAAVVRLVVESLITGGLDPSSIGVICPFRAQLRKMDDCTTLSARKKGGLELSTIDQFQGRDKPAIILSFVRSNVKGRVGRLLSDVRRLNVAFSRAKCKLIMVGSYSTLYSGSSVLRPVLDRVRKNGRIVELPSGFESC